MPKKNPYHWQPLSSETWRDFERLFGERGACGGCWCMTWRCKRSEFDANKGAGNKAAIRKLAKSGEPVGVLLYLGEEAIGWCSVAPREQFVALEKSRVWAPVDDKLVWSVTCFFVAKAYRKQGVTVELLNAAVEYARQSGATIVEGYPQHLKKPLPASFVWTGLYGSFLQAGFEEVTRRSKTKPIMRKLEAKSGI